LQALGSVDDVLVANLATGATREDSTKPAHGLRTMSAMNRGEHLADAKSSRVSRHRGGRCDTAGEDPLSISRSRYRRRAAVEAI